MSILLLKLRSSPRHDGACRPRLTSVCVDPADWAAEKTTGRLPDKVHYSERRSGGRLANPGKGNALSSSMRHDLSELWPKLADDLDVRVVIIDGEGDRHFCTGAELWGGRGDRERAAATGQRSRPHELHPTSSGSRLYAR
jgi:hypothetical protein